MELLGVSIPPSGPSWLVAAGLVVALAAAVFKVWPTLIEQRAKAESGRQRVQAEVAAERARYELALMQQATQAYETAAVAQTSLAASHARLTEALGRAEWAEARLEFALRFIEEASSDATRSTWERVAPSSMRARVARMRAGDASTPEPPAGG